MTDDLISQEFRIFLLKSHAVILFVLIPVTENEGSAILPDTAAAILAKIEERKLNPEEVAGIGVGVPSVSNRPSFTVVPPISAPKQYFFIWMLPPFPQLFRARQLWS